MSTLSRRFAALIVILVGVWGGIVPYVGPLFGYQMTPGQSAWSFTTASWELHLLPGIGAIVGGLLMLAGPPMRARLGGWLALASGGWFVLGPLFASMWLGTAAETRVASTGLSQAVRPLGYHYATGAVIIALAAWALGRTLPRLRTAAVATYPEDTGGRHAVPTRTTETREESVVDPVTTDTTVT